MSDIRKDDGGPAFPQGDFPVRRVGRHDGMALRDYLAAMAMQGDLAGRDPNAGYEYREIAIAAYRCADAMLEARKQNADD